MARAGVQCRAEAAERRADIEKKLLKLNQTGSQMTVTRGQRGLGREREDPTGSEVPLTWETQAEGEDGRTAPGECPGGGVQPPGE